MARTRAERRAALDKIKDRLRREIEQHLIKDAVNLQNNERYYRYRPRGKDEYERLYFKNEGKAHQRIYKCCSTDCPYCINNLTHSNTLRDQAADQEHRDWQLGRLDIPDEVDDGFY